MASSSLATTTPHSPLSGITPNPRNSRESSKAQAEVNSISFDQSRHGPDTIRIADSSGDPHNYGDLSPPEAVRQLQNSPAGYTFKDTLSTSDPGRLGAPDPLGLHLLIHRSGGVHTPPLSVLPCSPVSPRHHHIKPRAISDTFSSESSGSGSTESLPELGDESDHHRQVCATRSITNCGLLQRRSVQGRDDSGAVFVPPAAASLATTNPVSLKKEPGSSSTVATPPVGGAGEYTAVTKSNSSPRSDSTSERSNSDIEIYLDTHNLNNSVMRMTSVGNNNSTLGGTLNQDPCGSSAPPPTTHPAPIEVPVQSVSTQKEGPPKVADGWVTNQRTTPQGFPESSPSTGPQAHLGEAVKLRASTQESGGGNDTKSKIVPNDKNSHERQTGPTQSLSSRRSGEVIGDNNQFSKLALKPTSTDFKPRMATIELKPSVVEFKPARIELIPLQVSSAAKLPASSSSDGGGGGGGLSSSSAMQASFVPSTDITRGQPSNRTSSSQNFQNQVSNHHHPDDPAAYRSVLQTYLSCRGDVVGLGQDGVVVSDDQMLDEGGGTSEGGPQGLSSSSSLDGSHKTPNVYINGLPPHFPEDQLYALAVPFGEVKSVRTFTRHVRESESGYGFVLFETIEAAERCILSLRKYRNLHPTFSKQIHKIPGTVYAQSVAQNVSESVTSVDSWDAKRDESDSFKRRMESLADPTSTNLYMEGLPLSIDEPTLAALVSPHRISSSRFFQTRLSNPPRIIAFVRLETRRGAEEIIERLHGRMVRGWNDVGSRISVRFADTAEQRELRKRTERATGEGDVAPTKLTIAQAALLNLRGQELHQAAANPATLPVIGEQRRQNPMNYSYDNLSSNSLQIRNSQIAQPILEVDYSLVPRLGRTLPSQRIPSLSGTFQPVHGPQQNSRNVDVSPAVPIYLDGLRGNTVPFTNTGSSTAVYARQNSVPVQNQNQHYVGGGYGARPPPAQARSGYTPTEEFIMQAHAEAGRRSATTLGVATQASVDVGAGVRGYRPRTGAISLDRRGSSRLLGVQPTSMVKEGEFQPMGARAQTQMQSVPEQDPDVTVTASYNPHSSQNIRTALQDSFPPPILPPQSQTTSFDPVSEHHYNQHLRSTTYPYQPTPSQHQRHQQHSSLGNPATSQRTPQHASTAVMGGGQASLVSDKQNSFERKALRREASHNTLYSKLQLQHSSSSNPNLAYDTDNQPSPSLISPTLTYSSQTPSTLSPATPFFGSFTSQNECFERGFDGKKLSTSRSAAH